MSKLLTDKEAMQYLNIKSRTRFYRLLRQGTLKYIDLNPEGTKETRRYRLSDLEAYLQDKTPIIP